MSSIHQPEAIAETVFRVSQHPPRELWVGYASVKAIVGTMLVPAILDRLLARKGYEGQLTSEAQPADHIDNLFEPAPYGHAVRGRFGDEAKTRFLSINPAVLRTAVATAAVMIIAGAAVMTISLLH